MSLDIASVRASTAKAALNPMLWPETLSRLSEFVGSDMTVFEHIDKHTGTVEIGFNDQPAVIADTREAYERHFFALNPRVKLWRSLSVGATLHDDLIGGDDVLGGYEYYVDFLGPSGLKYFIGAAVADDADQTVILSMQRNADRGRVDEESRRAFAEILPDVRNAIAIYLRTIRAPCGTTLAAAFDLMADPVAVLRADGYLVFPNRAMSSLLSAGDMVVLRGRTLAGANESVSRALCDAMHRALAAPHSGVAKAGRLIFRIAPLAGDGASQFAPAADHLLCLLIDDPARPEWIAIEAAMRLWGLTRREATVGTHIAGGLAINQIAGRLGISRNTVLSHVAMLRDKLGVKSSLAVAAEVRRAFGPFA